MITMNVDMKGLTDKLDKVSKKLGESNKNAVARWGVQIGRELSVSTQAYGKSGTKKKQDSAIEAGVHSVVISLTGVRQRERSVSGLLNGKRISWPKSRFTNDAETLDRWIDRQRQGKARHTRRNMPTREKMAAPQSVVNKVIRARKKRNGIAKGAWLGAAHDIARYQTGADRINIGRNFLSYAQKHAALGKATRTASAINPLATLINTAEHSRSPYVLSHSESMKAIRFGLTKTIKWYEMTARRALK